MGAAICSSVGRNSTTNLELHSKENASKKPAVGTADQKKKDKPSVVVVNGNMAVENTEAAWRHTVLFRESCVKATKWAVITLFASAFSEARIQTVSYGATAIAVAGIGLTLWNLKDANFHWDASNFHTQKLYEAKAKG